MRSNTFKVIFIALVSLIVCGLIYFAFMYNTEQSAYSDNNMSSTCSETTSNKELPPTSDLRKSSKNNTQDPPKNSQADDVFHLAMSFDKKDFFIAWKRMSEHKCDLNTKQLMLSQMIIRMTEMGGEIESMDAIRNTFPEGKARSGLIGYCYEHSDRPELMSNFYESLSESEKNEAAGGCSSMIYRALERDLINGDFNLKNFAFLGKNLDYALSEAFDNYYMQNRSKDDVLDIMNNIFKVSPESKILGKMLYTASQDSGNASQVVDFINKHNIKLERGEMMNIFQAMLEENVQNGISLISNIKNISPSDKVTMFRNLLEIDPSLAKETHQENPFMLSAQASLAANSKKIGDAWEYVNQITDPVIKKQAEGQVWAKERDMVRNAVNKDPQQAINELVSGKSQHDAYWIEEAMDVWMQKDFDKAEQWYGDNWKKLPADKAQYAAAAFAKQAIKAGDAEAAAQWLPYIQDPKTKARIQADLDKALKD